MPLKVIKRIPQGKRTVVLVSDGESVAATNVPARLSSKRIEKVLTDSHCRIVTRTERKEVTPYKFVDVPRQYITNDLIEMVRDIHSL